MRVLRKNITTAYRICIGDLVISIPYGAIRTVIFVRSRIASELFGSSLRLDHDVGAGREHRVQEYYFKTTSLALDSGWRPCDDFTVKD
jgi:hypothetical protein